VSSADGVNPEQEALLADSVGLAMLVVLETLTPPERLAFVLHDMFGVPFDEIAPMVGRSPAAARQLASRARRRVQGEAPAPDPDLSRQREVVDAFFAAARGGEARPSATAVVHGAQAVAARASKYAQLTPHVRPALVNGAAGAVVAPRGRIFSVMAFTVRDGKIVAIDALSDPARLSELDLRVLD
jgi:Sigma-70, region 4